MAQTAEKIATGNIQFTYEDYLLLPEDGKRYEILEGELVMTPVPNLKHQNILSELGERIRKFVLKHRLGNVFYAPCDVIFSEHDIVQPDILFVSKHKKDIIQENNIQGTPDLVIEITSPMSQERDVVVKKKLYAKHGIKEYWIVFSQEEKVKVWSLDNKTYRLTGVYEKNGVLTSPLLEGLEIKLSEVFRRIEDYF